MSQMMIAVLFASHRCGRSRTWKTSGSDSDGIGSRRTSESVAEPASPTEVAGSVTRQAAHSARPAIRRRCGRTMFDLLEASLSYGEMTSLRQWHALRLGHQPDEPHSQYI